MRRTLRLAAVLLAPGCLGHSAVEPAEPPVAPPGAWTHSPRGPTVQAPDRWWAALSDPGLDTLVERALAGNLELRQAWARLDQAAALATQAGSGRWPDLGVRASSSRFQSIAPPGIPSKIADTSARSRYELGLTAGYELDLWGRIESQVEAAELDATAARLSAEAAAAALVGRIADAWYGLAEQQALLELLGRQEETNTELHRLVEARFARGLAAALDVRLQQQQLLATRAQVPLARARADNLALQLAVLAGLPPGALPVRPAAALPDVPPLPAPGLPAELVRRRPDLQAAARRVEAADRRVAAALSERFPAIRLSASAGMQSYELADLIGGWIWTLAGELSAPLLDGGRRAAEVERRRAMLREQLAAYGQALLAALSEVESALRGERGQKEYLSAARAQVEAARLALSEARDRYVRGLSDYLPVLTAVRSVQQSELAVVSARRAILAERVRLHVALGGGWTAGLGGSVAVVESP